MSSGPLRTEGRHPHGTRTGVLGKLLPRLAASRNGDLCICMHVGQLDLHSARGILVSMMAVLMHLCKSYGKSRPADIFPSTVVVNGDHSCGYTNGLLCGTRPREFVKCGRCDALEERCNGAENHLVHSSLVCDERCNDIRHLGFTGTVVWMFDLR